MKYSINAAKKEMKNIIQQYFRKDEEGNYLVNVGQALPLFLIGPAGIGKTQIVEEIAREQKLGFVSYSLVHHTKQTLMGLPVISTFNGVEKEMKNTEYTLSELIGMVYKQINEGHKEGILFLDEANCCSETIQPMLLAFLQSKRLGSSSLPEGWIIVLCGNPPKSVYNKSARAWDGALMDRLRVIELNPDNEEYMKYVCERGFHPAIQFYLTTHKEDAYVCDNTDDKLNIVTYRSWENLSNALYDYEKLGFEVTLVLINEYIKVDRVVMGFYEVYRYSVLEQEEYTELVKKFLEGNLDITIIESLKGKPMSLLYGITNLCFKQLDIKAAELLRLHEFQQIFQKKLANKSLDIMEIMSDKNVSPKIKLELEDIWRNTADMQMEKKCVELHNRCLKELGEERNELMRKTEIMFTELKKLGNPILMRFYMNEIQYSQAWIYVSSGGKNKGLEPFVKELEITFGGAL